MTPVDQRLHAPRRGRSYTVMQVQRQQRYRGKKSQGVARGPQCPPPPGGLQRPESPDAQGLGPSLAHCRVAWASSPALSLWEAPA